MAMESSMKEVVVEELLVSPCDLQRGGTVRLGVSPCPAETLGTGLGPIYP